MHQLSDLKSLAKSLVLLFSLSVLISCSDDKPIEEEFVSPILGSWTFSESRIEAISNSGELPINLNPPDVSGLEWTFLENDSLLVNDPDTVFTSWYKYDSSTMILEIDDGFYDVIKLNEDSLNLRFLSEIEPLSLEFHIYFVLLKGA